MKVKNNLQTYYIKDNQGRIQDFHGGGGAKYVREV